MLSSVQTGRLVEVVWFGVMDGVSQWFGGFGIDGCGFSCDCGSIVIGCGGVC